MSRITLTIETGQERTRHSFYLDVDEFLERELSERQELSNDPVSQMLTTGRMDVNKTFTLRTEKFKMRESFAKRIADQMVRKFVDYFGRNDVTDGFPKEKL